MRKLIQGVSVLAVAMTAACSGGSSPSSPSTPASSSPASSSGSAGTAVVSVTGMSAAAETTSTGVTYRTAFTINETSGGSAINMSSIRVTLASGSQTDGAVFNASDGITMRIAAGGSSSYRLGVIVPAGAVSYAQSTITINYTDDRGVAGTYTSGTASVSPPATSTPTPTPTPSNSYSATTTSATCVQTGKDAYGYGIFTLSQSGTATGGDVGSSLLFSQLESTIHPAQLTCSAWSKSSGNQFSCKRGASEPDTTNWSWSIQGYNPTFGSSNSVEVTLLTNVYDSRSNDRYQERKTVTCTQK